MRTSMVPTKYKDSKGRRIFLSVGGKPFVVTAAGKRQYKPVVRKMTLNNGSTRNVQRRNLKNIPNAIRPKRKPKVVVRKPRSNKGTVRSLVASPGGTVYKGMTSLVRAIRERNAAANKITNAIPALRKANRVVIKRLAVV